MDRLFLGQEVAVGIEQGDDAGVLPEVDAHELQARQVGAELADAGGLGVTDPHVLEDRAAAVEHQEPFVAAPGIDPRLGFRVGAEVARPRGRRRGRAAPRPGSRADGRLWSQTA